MDPQKELEYLREKVALLEKCVEYERRLREMREAAPREPVYVPYPYPTTPWTVPFDPTRLTWEPLIIPGPFEVPFKPWVPGRTTDPYRWWDNTVIC